MKVRVKYSGVIREIVKKREEMIELEPCVTLLDLLRLLAAKYGSNLESYAFEQNENVPRPIHLFLVNGKTFTASQTSAIKLNAESVVSIIPTQGG